MRKQEHTVSIRLSDVDLARYKRLLARHGRGFNDSSRFRSMLRKLDVGAPAATSAGGDHVETEDERLDREAQERNRKQDQALFG